MATVLEDELHFYNKFLHYYDNLVATLILSPIFKQSTEVFHVESNGDSKSPTFITYETYIQLLSQLPYEGINSLFSEALVGWVSVL